MFYIGQCLSLGKCLLVKQARAKAEAKKNFFRRVENESVGRFERRQGWRHRLQSGKRHMIKNLFRVCVTHNANRPPRLHRGQSRLGGFFMLHDIARVFPVKCRLGNVAAGVGCAMLAPVEGGSCGAY